MIMDDHCSRCGATGGDDACWALFHDVLAREYSDPAYGKVNLLTVDAHALQHPEDHGGKNNAFHLVHLCWLLDHDGDPGIGQSPRWIQAGFDGMIALPVLEPLAGRGELTVADVAGAATAAVHVERVKRWASSVWTAWQPHHSWTLQKLHTLMAEQRLG